LTESVDDFAAEEINELEGVLVLNRQAHEKLGAGRSAEPLLTFSLASKYRETVVGGTLTMTGWWSVAFINRSGVLPFVFR
jgi:hypothetical protein